MVLPNATRGGTRAGGSAWPQLVATLTIPAPLSTTKGKVTNPRSKINRDFGKALVAAGEDALIQHHKRAIPRKFHPQSQKQYPFVQRKPRTMEIKRKRHVGLLTKYPKGYGRERSVDAIRHATPKPRQVGNKSKFMQGTTQNPHAGYYVQMKLPMKKDFRMHNFPGARVSAQDILDEIAQWSAKDEQEANKIVHKAIVKFWRRQLAIHTRKEFKGYRTQLRAQGFNV